MPIAALLPDTEKSPPIASTRLFHQHQNDYESLQGFIQVYHVEIDTWSFVDSSDWNYSDAMVACKELGIFLVDFYFISAHIRNFAIHTFVYRLYGCCPSKFWNYRSHWIVSAHCYHRGAKLYWI